MHWNPGNPRFSPQVFGRYIKINIFVLTFWLIILFLFSFSWWWWRMRLISHTFQCPSNKRTSTILLPIFYVCGMYWNIIFSCLIFNWHFYYSNFYDSNNELVNHISTETILPKNKTFWEDIFSKIKARCLNWIL